MIYLDVPDYIYKNVNSTLIPINKVDDKTNIVQGVIPDVYWQLTQ